MPKYAEIVHISVTLQLPLRAKFCTHSYNTVLICHCPLSTPLSRTLFSDAMIHIAALPSKVIET
jgi:hypothetical protein